MRIWATFIMVLSSLMFSFSSVSAAASDYYYHLGGNTCYVTNVSVIYPKVISSKVDDAVNETFADIAMMPFGYLYEDGKYFCDMNLQGAARVEAGMKDISAKFESNNSYNSDYYLYTFTDELISYTQNTYIYLGGPHGSNIIMGVTIDMNTGKMLRLKDLFIKYPELQQNLQAVIDKQVEQGIASGEYFDCAKEEMKLTGEETFLYLIDKNTGKATIEIIVNEDRIAPHAAGTIYFDYVLE